MWHSTLGRTGSQVSALACGSNALRSFDAFTAETVSNYARTDHIDHYRLAPVDTPELLAQALAPDGAQRAIEVAREAGKVSYTGITRHRPEVLMAALETGRLDTVLSRYRAKHGPLPAAELQSSTVAQAAKRCDECMHCEARCPAALRIVPSVHEAARSRLGAG